MTQSQALKPTREQDQKPASWLDNPDAVQLVASTVAKDATRDELSMFLHLAREYGLDPFAKEIWFIKRGGSPTIMTSRDGYLKVANQHPQMRGLESDVVYEGDTFRKTAQGVEHSYSTNKRTVIVGAYALVYRRDRDMPTYFFAPFKDYSAGGSPTWRQYPHAMIVKVAEAMALKRAFALSGLVTQEEMDAGQQQPTTAQPPARQEPATCPPVEVLPREPREVLETRINRMKALLSVYMDEFGMTEETAAEALNTAAHREPRTIPSEQQLALVEADIRQLREDLASDAAEPEPVDVGLPPREDLGSLRDEPGFSLEEPQQEPLMPGVEDCEEPKRGSKRR